jgi:TIR domain
MNEYEYDVALSLAGEDRAYVAPIAASLRESGVNVFYYEFEQGAMWGEDLVVFLDEVFRKNSRYVVAFISRHYVEKVWPRHEGKSAQARALLENSPYFLPVRLDDSELPGLRPTVGYIDAREAGRDRLVELLLEKVGHERPVERVPRTSEEEAFVRATHPPGWEYLLFASVLRRRIDQLEPKWRDHELRYVPPGGRSIEMDEAMTGITTAFKEVTSTAGNIERVLSQESNEYAFGRQGEPGDEEAIEHLAGRVVDVYNELLDWAARLRGTHVPEDFRQLYDMVAEMADQPTREIRAWVDQVVREIDRLPEIIRREEPVTLDLTLTITADEEVLARFEQEIQGLHQRYGAV